MKDIRCGAVLFDMDGTLVDSTAVVERIWGRWTEQHGLDLKKLLSVSHGRRTIDTVRLVAPHLDAEAETRAIQQREDTDEDGIFAIAGALEVLNALHPDRWAVVTSASRARAASRIASVGLPVPRVLIGADDVAQGKPDPEGYLKAAAALGIAPARCVVVEDTPPGLEAGRAAGMQVLAITTTYDVSHLLGADAIADYTGVRFVIED